MKRKLDFKYLVLISFSFITFIVYLSTLRNEFIEWDDRDYVFKNPFIRSFNIVFFRRAFFDFHSGNWHPLTWISHALDYAFWGLNPLGHHLTNNILHAVNTFLVMFLIIKLLETARERTVQAGLSEFLTERTILIAAGATGLLFGLHPLHVESVAWVSERKDLLCALFFLLSIIQYVRCVRNENLETAGFSNKHYRRSLLFFILALLSKPMAVTLPFVLLILDWYPLKRVPSLKAFRCMLTEKLPFIALSVASSIVTFFAQHAAITPAVTHFETRAIVAAKALIMYLWKMLLPMNLVPLYLYPSPSEVSLLSFKYLSALVLVVGITAACFVIVKKQRVWLAVWGYYVLTLLPVIGIIHVGYQSMADRYTYLPSLGPFLMIGLGAAWIYKKASTGKRSGLTVQMLGVVTTVIIFVTLISLTAKQIRFWKNSFVFWEYVLEKEPAKSSIPHINLGMAYEEKHLLDKAMEQYKLALKADPKDAQGYNNLGMVYEQKGLIDQAIDQYQIALKLNPNYIQSYINMGIALSDKHLPDKAVEQYRLALKLDPNNAMAHNNIGGVYRQKSLIEEAIKEYQLALKLDPTNVLASINLGAVSEEKDLIDQAIEYYEIAVKSEPDSPLVHNKLGKAYEKKGLLDKAIEQYEIIVRLRPNYAVAHNDLGDAYQKKRLLNKAIEQYQITLQYHPDDFDAHTNLGLAYKEKGLKEQALSQFRMAVKLKPESPLAHNNLGTAYGMFGLTDRAVEQFREAVRLEPQNPTWRSNLAIAYEQRRLGK